MTGEAILASSQSTRAQAAPPGRFFQGTAAVLLLVVLVGFGRTLFLRPLFDVPPIPWYLYLHGAMLAGWFILLFIQTSLIATRRARLHRQLGILGGVLAVGVVSSALAAVLGFPAHAKQGTFSIGGPGVRGAVLPIVWTDFAGLALFGTFIAIALIARKRPATHKRLLLLGSSALMLPAAARTGGVLIDLLQSAVTLPIPAMVLISLSTQALVLLGPPIALVIHDLRTARRLHSATLWGVGAYCTMMVGAQLVASTQLGRAVVTLMGG